MDVSRRLQVFLCHSSGDKPAIRKLNQVLLDDGFDPWLDECKLIAGQNWDATIRRAVSASHVVLVCLSRNAITKEGYLQKEIRLALDVAEAKPFETIFLIPVLLEDCPIPERLQSWQWVHLADLEGLYRALDARTAQLGIPARDPSSHLRRLYAHRSSSITFFYEDSPTNHGWEITPDVGYTQNAVFDHVSRESVGMSLRFSLGDGTRMDWDATAMATPSSGVDLLMIPEPGVRFYVRVGVRNAATGEISALWLNFQPEVEAIRLMPVEWLLPLPAFVRRDGWTSAFLALPEIVAQTYPGDTMMFDSLQRIRIRGSGTLGCIDLVARG